MKKSLLPVLLLAVIGLGAPAPAQNAVSLHPSPAPQGPQSPLAPGDCALGQIYDDGAAENGYSGNPALITDFQGVMLFTPPSYPYSYSNVCVGLVSLAGANLDFEIQVHDDDGPGGEPGTLLGTVAASETTLPAGLPCTFFSVDISSMNLSIASGDVWIGVRWNPTAFPSRFICSDESGATALRPGRVNFNNPSTWQATEAVFPAYRAKLIRALGAAPDADLSVLKTGVESAPGQVVFTITATNNGPADATNVVVSDALPAALNYVSDDCGGVNGPPWTWNVGTLANGASASCHVTTAVTTPGPVTNTATISGDQPDPNPANSSSVATLVTTGVFGAAISTLGVEGLVALGLLVAVGAALLLRRGLAG